MSKDLINIIKFLGWVIFFGGTFAILAELISKIK